MSNSLVDEIDVTSIIGELIALRAYSQKSVLIVEGPSDSRFFSAFITHDDCDIIISHGREYAVEVIRAIYGTQEGVLAVIDRDLDDLFSGPPDHENVIITDCTDVEVMMIRSTAFDSVLWELGSMQKIRELLQSGIDVRGLLLHAARRLLILKYVSRKQNLGLRFRGLRMTFVDKKLEYNTEDMVTAVLNHSRVPSSAVIEIVSQVREVEGRNLDLWTICSGHIMCGFIGRALQQIIGSLNTGTTSVDEVESRLRTGFSDLHFKACDLYEKIRNWEERNRPYIILRPDLS